MPAVTHADSPSVNRAHSAWNVVIAFAIFTGVMAVALGGAILWEMQFDNSHAAWVAIASWGMVVTGALVSLAVSAIYRNTPHAASANLFGMLPRMAVPLVAMMGLGKVWPDWSACDGPNVLMTCYLVSLTTEVIVTVCFLTVTKPVSLNEKSSAPSTTPMGA